LLAKHGTQDQPLLIGLLHKARAEVALLMKDLVAFDEHAAEVERRFRGTKNPALIAQCERLMQQAVRRGLKRFDETISAVQSGHEATLIATQQRIVSELGTASDPHDFALRLVVQESRGSGGFLYLYQDKSLQLVAASSADDPPREIERELLQRVQRVEFEAAEEGGMASSVHTGAETAASTIEGSHVAVASNVGEEDEPETQFVASEPPETQAAASQTFVLSTRQHGRSVVVGGVIVRAGASGIPRIDPGVLGSIARILYERQSSTVM
jgi:hypothetical protein